MATTLYERLGGRDAISTVVAEFCARSVSDPRIESPRFDAQVDVLVATLGHFGVAADDQAELLSLLAPMRDDIVEIESFSTGTPLPAAYQMAPPLR